MSIRTSKQTHFMRYVYQGIVSYYTLFSPLPISRLLRRVHMSSARCNAEVVSSREFLYDYMFTKTLRERSMSDVAELQTPQSARSLSG
jgi:hypothetical protein